MAEDPGREKHSCSCSWLGNLLVTPFKCILLNLQIWKNSSLGDSLAWHNFYVSLHLGTSSQQSAAKDFGPKLHMQAKVWGSCMHHSLQRIFHCCRLYHCASTFRRTAAHMSQHTQQH